MPNTDRQRLAPEHVGRTVVVRAKATSPETRAVVVEVAPSGACCVVPLRKDGTPIEQERWTGTYHTVRLV